MLILTRASPRDAAFSPLRADDVPLPEGGHKGAKIPAAEDTAEVVVGWIENIQVMQTGSA